MIRSLLGILATVWVLDGLALLANPRGLITLLGDLVERHGHRRRWWAVTSGLGLPLLWLPTTFPYRPLWFAVACLMVAKGLFLGLAPERWHRPLLAWCLSREDVDYRFWGLGLCALGIVLWHSLGTMHVEGAGR